jgi:hypothetical protein
MNLGWVVDGGKTPRWTAGIIGSNQKKKMTLGWVVNSKKTPRWTAGGIDPPRPLDQIRRGR